MARILLVEDNEMNRTMIARYLEFYDYMVMTAEDGRTALEMAQTTNPDLILMDISLPVLDGWEVTKRLKSAPDTANIPIIALTAHAMVTDRQQSFEAGCNDYETKPIDFQRLLGKIHSLLQLAS
jgi:two-component system cell cycle response regulator DivK